MLQPLQRKREVGIKLKTRLLHYESKLVIVLIVQYVKP